MRMLAMISLPSDVSDRLGTIVDVFAAELAAAAEQRMSLLRLLPELALECALKSLDRRAISIISTLAENPSSPAGPLVWYLLTHLYREAAHTGPTARLNVWADALTSSIELDRTIECTPLWNTDVSNVPNPLIVWSVPPALQEAGLVNSDIGPSGEREAFVDCCRSAISMLSEVSPRLSKSLRQRLRWIVPIAGAKNARNSFTFLDLPGAVFVGSAENIKLISELTLHEFLHLILHEVSVVRPLVSSEHEPVEVYSPWRADARPAEGLLHGIYVFSGVLSFWLDRMQTDEYSRDHARHRISDLRMQLKLAVASLECTHLNEIGSRVVAIAKDALVTAFKMGIERECVDATRSRAEQHLNTWIASHPNTGSDIRSLVRIFESNQA